jgi:hexosaminidase
MRPTRALLAVALTLPLCAVSVCSSAQNSAEPDLLRHTALLPVPAHLTPGQGEFAFTQSFTAALPGNASPRLQAATLRTLRRLEDKTGLPLARQLSHDANAALTIAVSAPDTPVQSIDDDESYSLRVTPTGVHIDAPTTVGALHGLETLVQLVQPQGSGFILPALTVQDSPRFRWRGLMIDCGRHFEPLEVLKRNIDAMAAVKLNVFHWHLTEDQGFRIESKRFPKLTGLGSDGLFYTQDQARELVQYARDRGIRVVPEFEMPGHSSAWLVAYPELASGSNPPGIRREFGISDYVLDPTRDETYTFIEQFLAEMVTIFPDQYVHIGGDEAPAPDWKTNPRILAFMKAHNLANNDALQAYFNTRVLAILTKLHRRMVGWDEIFNPGLPKDVVIQSWRGEASLAKAASVGYQGVLSAPYYLDAMKPAGVHYLADPIPADTKLTPDQQKLILGGEVCMWAEQLDAHTIDSRIWPRTAAIAERFWSAQNVRDVDDMYRRLDPVSVELETLGARHLTSEDAGLRDLAHRPEITDLRTFASAFEPVSFPERYKGQHTSQLTPLWNFVDAVTPDPPIRYQLLHAAGILSRDPQGSTSEVAAARTLLGTFFTNVGASVPRVAPTLAADPRLQAIQPRAEQLAALTTIGTQALGYLQNGQAPAGWKQSSLAQIETTKTPIGLVRFHFLDALSELVNAVR